MGPEELTKPKQQHQEYCITASGIVNSRVHASDVLVPAPRAICTTYRKTLYSRPGRDCAQKKTKRNFMDFNPEP
jgi:hypothetical protein